jgi:multisubunit Na+/H+ antiporter MnhB subunit
VTPFTIGVLAQAAFAGTSGALILVFRKRVLQFVRARYERMYREDRLDAEEISRRVPKMWIVVLIGVGALIVAAIALTAAWASATQCAEMRACYSSVQIQLSGVRVAAAPST